MIAADERRLLIALAASLALHAFFIAAMRAPQPSPILITPPPLEVKLAKEERVPEVAPVAPSVPMPEQIRPKTTTHRSGNQHKKAQTAAMPPPVPKPAQPVEAAPSLAQPVPASPNPAPSDMAIESIREERPTLANREAPASANRAVAGPVSSESAAAEVRADSAQALLAYGRLLSQAIAREQRYPRVARQNGWQGTVELALEVAAGNRLRQVTVVRSSGYGVLDQCALEMAYAVRPLPPLPEALQRQDFKVQVPISFRLQD